MRGVWACLCAIGALLVLSAPAAGKPRPRVDAQTSATPVKQSERSKTGRNDSSKNGTSENGSSENDSSENGSSSQNGEESGADDEIDTADIFGFTEGSDTSAKDTRVLTHDVVGRFGRRSDFAGLRGSIGVTFSPSDKLQISINADSDYEQSRGDPLLDELKGSLAFGLGASAKYRILEREKDSLFGVAVQVAPAWQRSVDLTGGETDFYGAEFRLMVDYEFLPKQLVGAVNLAYRPEGQNETLTGTFTTASEFEAAAALTSRIGDSVYLGGEVRYITRHEGVFFDSFSGWGLFVGPNIYVTLSENAYVGAAWSVQVAGNAAEEPGQQLDLINFSRHQFRIKSGITF